MEGRLIGQYRVTGVLGNGGMGVVYAARHTLLDRPAAVKVLLPKLSDDQAIVTRFFNEARAATAIRHPGIVEVYDFGWTPEGAAFIVMEHLQGETLRARRKRRPMPWGFALAITRQIAGALSAAHATGIVHRDLKPDNIFLVPDPEVPGGERIKLLDFGIAKLAGTLTDQSMTRTGAVMGTPAYMAPEQCRGVVVDWRADLYSLGCILFELLAGQPPFVGEGGGEVLAAHIHVPPPALGSLTRGLPSGVEDLVQRLLAKAPHDRVQTADAVIQYIDAAGSSRGGQRALPSSPLPPLRPPASPAASAPFPADGIGHANTTLSSAISASPRSPATPARRKHLVRIGVAGSVIALAAIMAHSVGGGGDEHVLATASSPHGPAGAATDAAQALPPPPSAPPPSQSAAASAAASAPSASPPSDPPTSPAPIPSPTPSAAKAPTRAKSSPPVVARASPPKPEPTRQPPVALAPSAPSTTSPPVVSRDPPLKPEPTRPLPLALAPSASSTDEVKIEIVSSPPGAEVVRDGKVVGKTPCHVTLDRTDTAVRLSLRLSKHAQEQLVVSPRGPLKQVVKLRPVADGESVNPFK